MAASSTTIRSAGLVIGLRGFFLVNRGIRLCFYLEVPDLADGLPDTFAEQLIEGHEKARAIQKQGASVGRAFVVDD